MRNHLRLVAVSIPEVCCSHGGRGGLARADRDTVARTCQLSCFCAVACCTLCLPSTRPQPQQPAFVKSSGRGDRVVDASGALKALGADSKVADSLGLGYGLAAAAAGSKPRPSAAPQQPGQRGGSGSKGGDPRAAPAAAAALPRPPSGSQRSSGKLRPIILVPAGYSALVNLYNAKQLLEQHQFVPRWGVLLFADAVMHQGVGEGHGHDSSALRAAVWRRDICLCRCVSQQLPAVP